MVLLRTYDERSVVYHRQGRIGTYAIFWNHEAMQAGSVHALDDDDWIFPSYRESAIGLLRGMPAGDDAALVARPSRRLVEPGRLQRRVDLRADRDAGAARGRARVGQEAEGRAARARSRTSATARRARARSTRARTSPRSCSAPLVLFCNNNQWAISTPLSAQTRAETLADKAVGYGMPGVRVDGGDVLAVYEATREAVERARAGGGPTFIEAVTYRAAPHATADDPRAYIDLERVEEEKRNECVGRYERYLPPARRARRRARRGDQGGGAEADARRASPRRRPSRTRRSGLVFEHAYVDPPRRSRTISRAAADPRATG